MKDITNKFQQYFDKLSDEQKKSLAQNLGTVVGLGMGIGTGAILGDVFATDQQPIHRPSLEEMDNNIVTRQEMTEQFPESYTTGEGVHKIQQIKPGEFGYEDKVEGLLQSKQTPIYEENTNQRLSRDVLSKEYLLQPKEYRLQYTAHYVDGTTSTVDASPESLTDARTTSYDIFTTGPNGDKNPIESEKYLEGENSNLNGIWDMPFASEKVKATFHNSGWASGAMRNENDIVKEVAYYTVDTDPEGAIDRNLAKEINKLIIAKKNREYQQFRQ